MALITCPECKNQISDRAEKCPHCGLPSQYFHGQQTTSSEDTRKSEELDYRNLSNILLSFDKDYCGFFADSHYITHREEEYLNSMYAQYYKTLCNKMIFQYVCNNARSFRVDIDLLKAFLTKMHTLSADVLVHNTNYVDRILVQEKEYFDHILEEIDPVIKLDEEQRRAVITDDDHCLLVAGAGAGKTTTMAAKVKYLVEKQGVQLNCTPFVRQVWYNTCTKKWGVFLCLKEYQTNDIRLSSRSLSSKRCIRNIGVAMKLAVTLMWLIRECAIGSAST